MEVDGFLTLFKSMYLLSEEMHCTQYMILHTIYFYFLNKVKEKSKRAIERDFTNEFALTN